MIDQPRRRFIAGLLLADVLVFGGWITALQFGRHGNQLKLPVEGYDPRDLLSGHYVSFRLAAEREATALLPRDDQRESRDRSVQRDFCLDTRDDRLHPTRLRGSSDDCEPYLRGSWDGYRMRFGADRFYVDERRAKDVTFVRAGPQTYLLATVDRSGEVHPLDLVVEGKSLSK